MGTQNNERRVHWQAIIDAQATSGMTQVRFCADQDINLHNFQYWKRKLIVEGTAPAIQVACYQIDSQVAVIDSEPELETQGIMVPVGASGMVTITGRLSIGQLTKIMAACTAGEPRQAREIGVGDVPA